MRALFTEGEEVDGEERIEPLLRAACPVTSAHLGSESASPGMALGRDDVHLWWIDLEDIESDIQAVLSTDERARAERFRHPRDRAEWTTARMALRQILARYTTEHPATIRFTQGVRGKPALTGGSSFRFSLTHARDRAAVAVSWEREVGIDLEPIDPRLDVSRLLPVVCSRTEAARIDAHPPAARLETFLAHWTCKEAYLKGIGTGLYRDPRTVELELLDDDWTAVRDSIAGTPGPPWHVRLLDAGPGWIAALANSGQEPSLTVYRWPLKEIAPVAEGLGSMGNLSSSTL
jgi:4'-phosphopantetheinyl transferase